MIRNTFTICLLGAAVGLAGCSSNNKGESLLSTEEAALQVFATTDEGETAFDNLLAALEAGPVYARRVTTANLDEDYTGEGTAYALNKKDFDVEITDSGTGSITFTIDGVPYDFDEDDVIFEEDCPDGCNWRIEGETFVVDIYPVRESVDRVYDGASGRYMQAFGYYLNPDFDAGMGHYGFGVVGTETRTSELDDRGDATATYFGNAQFEVREQGADYSEFNARARADVELTADFGANTISGTGDVYQVRTRAGNTVLEDFDPDAGIIFEKASIQGNAFLGDLNPDEALIAEVPYLAAIVGASTYSGAFYGPTGEQIGGVTSGSVSFDGDEYLMIGTFEAFED